MLAGLVHLAGRAVGRPGPIGTGPYDVLAQVRSAADADRPDVQVLATPMSIDPAADRLRLARHAGMMLQGYQIRPTSTGSVHLGSADPAAPPRLAPAPLTSEVDRRVTGRVLDLLRDLAGTAPLRELVLAEDGPGPQVRTAEQVIEHARRTGAGLYHAVGTCALGPDDGAVLDLRLRVRGTAGLRVVDASAFPAMPAANTAAPVVALAWRAAGLVREDA